MMRAIHKYKIDIDQVFMLPYHPDNKVVYFAQQYPGDRQLYMWIEEVGSSPMGGAAIPESQFEVNTAPAYHVFKVFATGHILHDERYVHRGTAVCDHGAFVWHLYEVLQ